MKTLSLLFATLFAYSLNAATSLSWLADGWTPVTGTAYLVQMTDSSVPTISAIADYIKQNGLTPSGNYNYSVVSDPFSIDNSTTAIDDTITLDPTLTNKDNLSNFFTIIVSSDQKSFSISSYNDAVGTLATDNSYPTLEVNHEAFWGETTWTDGSVGNVPEPTVLALLALGVAGVALRRKKVVA